MNKPSQDSSRPSPHDGREAEEGSSPVEREDGASGRRRPGRAESHETGGGNGASPPNGGLGAERMAAIREALREKRSEIVEQQATQLSALHAPDKHHLADLEEMASDTVDTDSLCALVDIGSSTLAEIDTALLKIEEGTYGTCELCEKPIHPDRLEVLPFAPLCVKCQSEKEAREGSNA